jgi:hypothetical protein
MKHPCLTLLCLAALLPSAFGEDAASLPRFGSSKVLAQQSLTKTDLAHEAASLGAALPVVAVISEKITEAPTGKGTPSSSPVTEVPALEFAPFPDSYVEYFSRYLEDQRRGFGPGKNGKLQRVEPDYFVQATVAHKLWKKTGNPAFKTEALDSFSRIISDPKLSLASFGRLRSFGELAAALTEDRLLTPELRESVSQIAGATLADYLKQPDDMALPVVAAKSKPDAAVEHPVPPYYNIRMAQIAGYAGLLKCLKDEPFEQRDAVARRINAYFERLCLIGNTDEDSSNYDCLGATFMIDIARVLNREDEFKSPSFRRFFEHFRDIVSPAGIIPEYGDSYFEYYGGAFDRLYLLEYAARFYKDPSFAEASRQMRARPWLVHPDGHQLDRAPHLILFGKPYPVDEKTRLNGTLSTVLFQNIPLDAEAKQLASVPFHLVLRTGTQPGDAMILMDLYATGGKAHIHHAHREKGPSVGYYESGQVPLFHNMGRRGTESANDGNICWALPPDVQFPGHPHPDEWFTMSFPAETLASNADGQLLVGQMSIRNFSGSKDNKECTSLKIDNLRLEGPAGTRLVDGFTSPEEWVVFGDKASVTSHNSSDATEGGVSQEFPWNQLKTDLLLRKFPKDYKNEPFTPDQYDTVKVDLKYSGSRPYFGIRGIAEAGIEIGTRYLRPKLRDAAAEQRASDALGTVRYDRYVTPDSALNRRLLLTKEGYLIIRDQLTPGPSMNGWNAGQLWQLYTLGAQGEHWFCSADDGLYPDVIAKQDGNPQRRMLVRFADGNGPAGFEKVPRSITWPNPKGLPSTSYMTTFSSHKVIAGQPAVFAMVVLPVLPEVDPATLAKDVFVTTTPDGVVNATIGSGTNQVVVHIGENDWSVKR